MVLYGRIEFFIYFIFAKCQRSALVPPLFHMDTKRKAAVSQSDRRVVIKANSAPTEKSHF